jgi:formate dehydrogenase major subunit
MTLSRRGFFRLTGTGLAGSSLAALGFGTGEAVAASVRPFKLARATETRNTCPYCSVSCGVILYTQGDRAKNAKSEIIHVEGDPDHPVNRGTLCPKGASLLDFIKSPTRVKYPMHRTAGSREWKRVSWEFALDRISKLMKEDRDKNFVAKNSDGVTVNRWPTVGFLAASATSNETAFMTYKVVRSSGMVVFDNQARV